MEIPNVCHPFQLINRIILLNAIKNNQNYLRGKILDLGCGRRIYEKYVKGEYYGLDLPQNTKANIKYDLTQYPWPIKDNTFDNILCIQVIDDFFDPAAFIKEIKRILKKNGVAIISSSFVWELHFEPNDYYRFSEHSLKKYFTNEGFKIIKFQRLGSYPHVIGQVISAYLEIISRKFLLFSPVFAMVSLLNSFFWLLIGFFSNEKRLYLINLIVVQK